jgi:predicted dienelactone hydrolase
MNQKMRRLLGICKVMVVLTVTTLLIGSAAAQDTAELPLADTGPFAVGMRYLFLDGDPSRDTGRFPVAVWYPAVGEARDAAPDLSDAPYPVIIYSHGLNSGATDIAEITLHLASYGFVVAAATHRDYPDRSFVDRPLDIQHLIHQLAALPDDPLNMLMDMEQIGVLGVSLGGMTALQMGGMHMDWPATQELACDTSHFFPSMCASEAYSNRLLSVWEEFGARDEGGLWYVPTDIDIRAIAAAAPCCIRLFGEDGLAAANVPALILHGTADIADSDYEHEGVYAYEHYGSEERILLSFIGGNHYFGILDPHRPRFKHFLTAFFGYHLQGREDYAHYLSDDYANSIEGLFWGPYEGE